MIVQSSDTPVGVRNLIKERQKYLFRSILTRKKQIAKAICFFQLYSPAARVASKLAPRAKRRGKIVAKKASRKRFFQKIGGLGVDFSAVMWYNQRSIQI